MVFLGQSRTLGTANRDVGDAPERAPGKVEKRERLGTSIIGTGRGETPGKPSINCGLAKPRAPAAAGVRHGLPAAGKPLLFGVLREDPFYLKGETA